MKASTYQASQTRNKKTPKPRIMSVVSEVLPESEPFEGSEPSAFDELRTGRRRLRAFTFLGSNSDNGFLSMIHRTRALICQDMRRVPLC